MEWDHGRSGGCRRVAVRRKVRPASVLVTGAVALALAGTVPAAADAQQSAAAASLVFDAVTVVDVEQGKLVPAQRVVIAGNRIQAMGNVGAVRMPPGARVVDARGKYLIPGLWDLHTHWAAPFYPLFVANGVTGIRDAWTTTPIETLVQWRDEILAGTRVGPPRQLLTGLPFNKEPSYDELVDELTARKARGTNFLKIYAFSYKWARAARQVGLPFGGHVGKVIEKSGSGSSPVYYSAIEASDSGSSILDHVDAAGGLDTLCWGDVGSLERCRPVAERLLRNGTWFVPTLIVMSSNEKWGAGWGRRSQPILDRLVKRGEEFWTGSLSPGNWLRDSTGAETPVPRRPGSLADSLGVMYLMQRLGFPILAGTDATNYQKTPWGFSLHTELAMYVAEGLTPLDALRTATLNPAKLLRGTDSLGTVAPGKLADLVLLDADPLADITNTTMIRAVVANGRYFDRAALDQLLAEVRTTGKGRR